MQYSQKVSATSAILNRDVAHETTDEALIASIAQGDKRALQTLYGRHNVRVYRFALRFLNDEALAEDMVSEVFFDVWRQADRFEARSKVSTWLLAMARNKALSVLRRRSTEELDEEVAEFIEILRTIRKSACRRSNRLRCCRSALPSCLRPIAKSSISSITMARRSRKSLRSPGCRSIR